MPSKRSCASAAHWSSSGPTRPSTRAVGDEVGGRRDLVGQHELLDGLAAEAVAREQRSREARADEAAAAGDQEFHGRGLLEEGHQCARHGLAGFAPAARPLRLRCRVGRLDQAGDLQPAVAAPHVLDGAPPRQARLARLDRVDDRAVLGPHVLHEVGAARLVAARHPHRLGEVLLEELEQAAEVRVAGGIGQRAVEREVLGDAVAALGGALVDRLQRAPQRRDLQRASRGSPPARRSRLRARAGPRGPGPPPRSIRAPRRRSSAHGCAAPSTRRRRSPGARPAARAT